MIVFESRAHRRLLLRLERGDELVESLERLAEQEGVRAAWVRGVGTLGAVELDRHDTVRKKAEPPERYDTPSELLTLEGSIALEGGTPVAALRATLARRTDNGVSVIGGRLRRADVFTAELIIECFDDVELERKADEKTGLRLWVGDTRELAEPKRSTSWTREKPAEPRAKRDRRDEDDEGDDDYDDGEDESAAASSAPSKGQVTWADVARASAEPEAAYEAPPARRPATAPKKGHRPPPIPARRKTTEAEFMEQAWPVKGDFVQHRQFGQCKVEKEDGNGGIIIKLASGVRKTIKLDYMEVGASRMEGRKRVFPIRPRRR